MSLYNYLPGAKACIRIAGVKDEDHVLIITDLPMLADYIGEAIKKYKIKCECGIIYIPQFMRPMKKLPDCLEKSILASNVVFTILEGKEEETAFRKSIVQLATGKRKIFNMISVKEEMFRSYGALSLSKDEFNEMVELTKKFALVLTMARGAKIQSAIYGETNLEINLEGSMKPAIISTGAVLEGSWGNLPSGEAFILPRKAEDNGKMIVDGAITYLGPLIDPIKFEVIDNKINLIEANNRNNRGARKFKALIEKIRNEAKKNGEDTSNITRVCEFGIGTNPKAGAREVIEIEKIRGTIHIGIGDNSQFGGPIRAPSHIDMVITSPIVTIDRKYTIIDRGFVKTPIIENYLSISYESFPDRLPPNSKIKVKDKGAVGVYETYLEKVWKDNRGNKFSWKIGDDETARMVRDIWDSIDKEREQEYRKLCKLCKKYDESIVCQLINVLNRYDVIEIVPQTSWS
ncbi:MAG: hypothetical protein ACFFCW_34520 [Candidatus Hodarchaeota archaeon]